MTWYEYLGCALGAGGVLAYLTWIGVAVLGLQRDYTMLKARLDATDHRCAERVGVCGTMATSIQALEDKVDQLGNAIARLDGKQEMMVQALQAMRASRTAEG